MVTWGVTRHWPRCGAGSLLVSRSLWAPLTTLSTGRGNGFLPTAPPSLQPTPFLSENRYLNEGQYNLLNIYAAPCSPPANGDDASQAGWIVSVQYTLDFKDFFFLISLVILITC